MFDQNEGEQRQALGGLVDLRTHLLGDKIVEAARIADQLEAERLEQRTVLVLHVGQLGVALGLAARQVIALEQLAEDRRQLGHFFQVDVHTQLRQSSCETAKRFSRKWVNGTGGSLTVQYKTQPLALASSANELRLT